MLHICTLHTIQLYFAVTGVVEKRGRKWMADGAAAWRIVAIIYCIVGIISNTLSCFSVKELSDAELRDGKEEEDSKLTLAETFKLLISNKYFVMICVVYILQQLRAAMLSVGTYFMTYVLFNQKLFGVFSWAINIPLIKFCSRVLKSLVIADKYFALFSF